MRPSPAQMVWSTCVSVLHMSKMIQVRNVPDEVHRKLKTRAAAAGMSLSDYIKRDLVESASKRTLDDIFAEARARPRTEVTTEMIVEIQHELRGD